MCKEYTITIGRNERGGRWRTCTTVREDMQICGQAGIRDIWPDIVLICKFTRLLLLLTDRRFVYVYMWVYGLLDCWFNKSCLSASEYVRASSSRFVIIIIGVHLWWCVCVFPLLISIVPAMNSVTHLNRVPTFPCSKECSCSTRSHIAASAYIVSPLCNFYLWYVPTVNCLPILCPHSAACPYIDPP